MFKKRHCFDYAEMASSRESYLTCWLLGDVWVVALLVSHVVYKCYSHVAVAVTPFEYFGSTLNVVLVFLQFPKPYLEHITHLGLVWKRALDSGIVISRRNSNGLVYLGGTHLLSFHLQ